MEICSVCGLFGDHKSHKMVEIRNLGANIREISESSKATMKSLTLLEDFKKHATFGEFAAEKLRASVEFNKRQLQIIYKNLKNLLKTRIFGNLEAVQQHLEEQVGEVFPADLPEFKQYKKLAASLESKMAEIAALQKESASKDVFVFTRLSKLQGDLRTLKRADSAFRTLTDKCLQFNIETELNFQLFEELIVFKNEVMDLDQLEGFKNSVQVAFDKSDDFGLKKGSTVAIPAFQGLPDLGSGLANIQRKQSLQVLKGTVPKKTGARPDRLEYSQIVDNSAIGELVPAITFIEQNQKNMRASVNPKLLSHARTKTDEPGSQAKSSVANRGSARKIHVSPTKAKRLEQSERELRNFKKHSDSASNGKRQLFEVHDESAVVSKLQIDFEVFQGVLDKISDCPTLVSQIIFKGNTFKINPVHALLELFEGPVNESLTIDLRDNKFPEATKFLELEVYELEKMNVFVLV